MIPNEKIKKAIEVLKRDGYWGENENVKAFDLLLDTAQSYLELKAKLESVGSMLPQRLDINDEYFEAPSIREILEKLIRRGMKPSEQADYSVCIKKDVDLAHQEIMKKLPSVEEIKIIADNHIEFTVDWQNNDITIKCDKIAVRVHNLLKERIK